MMPRQKGRKRGAIHNLNFAYQRIDRAISSLNGKCFTPKEIHKITWVNQKTILSFLARKTIKGFLERIRRGCYRKTSDGSLTKRLSQAFVAKKVWRILSQSEKPLIHREISQIITEDTELDLYFNIGMLLMEWHCRNALDKLGSKRPYAYQIKPGYKGKDRPSASLCF